MAGIRKRFGGTAALDGVDFAVQAGEVHALVGENGAGKSTLMKVLSGAVRPDAGAMRLDGASYEPRNPVEARRAGVAMVYQELSLAPHLTVAENIFLGLERSRWGFVRTREQRSRAAEVLAEVGRPDLSPRACVGDLPPPARQIVEIARSVALGGRVIVFDEPTSSLGRGECQRLFAVIRRLRDRGYGVVYISHFLEEVAAVADCVTVLRDGAVAGRGRAGALSSAEIIQCMIGERVEDLYPRSPRTPGEVVLEVHELAGAVLPRQATLALRRGEILGIAGLVGAGRTEMLRALFGLAPVRGGRVRLGVHSGRASPRQRWRQGAGLVSEDRKNEGLAGALSVADNLTLSRLPAQRGLVFRSRQGAAADRWIRAAGIRCRSPWQRVGELSGGNQQKVALARLLHHDVDVWLLDEPTRGVDVASKAQIYRLMDALVAPTDGARPKAVLMVSSYLPELLGVCDRIAVMCRGRLGPARPAGAWSEPALLAAVSGVGEVADA
jgi:ribose transport system ATP-binding protein